MKSQRICFKLISILAAVQVCICRSNRGRGTDPARRSVRPSFILPREDLCNEQNCNEADERSFHCGSNGRTYGSYCETIVARCKDRTLTFTQGKCQESKVCVRYREHVLKNFKNSNSRFVPMCNSDGTYAPLQCSFGNCWCNEKNGKIIANEKGRKHRKVKKSRKIPKCGPRHNNKCKTDADKLSFAYKVRGLLEMSYRLSLAKTSANIVSTTTIEAVRWKMESFSRGRTENFMYYKEFKTMFRSYKHAVSKPCSKMLPKYCDGNKDKRVSELELLVCMGVSDTPTIIPDQLKNKTTSKSTPDTTNIQQNETQEPVNDTPTPERITCRENQRQTIQAGKPNVLIPTCEGPNGEFWKRFQCYADIGYCFCVNMDDGQPIPNSSWLVADEPSPNCDIAAPRKIPGCSGNLKEKFLTSVVYILLNEWAQRDRSEIRPEDELTLLTDGERAARWYFDQTDSNNDGDLSRSENKVFKKLLSRRKVKQRKCLRKFQQHCDRNKNKKITIGEFVLCLEVNITKPPISSRRITPSILIGELQATDDPEGF